MSHLILRDTKGPLYDHGAGITGTRLLRDDPKALTYLNDSGELALSAHGCPIRTMEYKGIEFIHTRDNAGHILRKTLVGRSQHHHIPLDRK